MDNKQKLRKLMVRDTALFVKKTCPSEGSHDWHHIERVWNTAKLLQKKEGGDPFVVEMTALLHDVDDWKFSGSTRGKKASHWLSTLGLPKQEIGKIKDAIGSVSFKGARVNTKAKTIEARIVQDADRLDALGAVGIARCFAYGGHKGHAIYDPAVKPTMHPSFSQYRKARTTSINHFYEKLLLLRGRMNTKAAKALAKKRHDFMRAYLKQFFREAGKET